MRLTVRTTATGPGDATTVDQHEALVGPVTRFVDDVAAHLVVLARHTGDAVDAAALRADAAAEAARLVAAFIDADGVHTDAELWAYLRALAPHDPTLSWASPDDLRVAGVIGGQRVLVDHPTELFTLLVDADAHDGGHRSWDYFQRAMDVAHTVASLDVHTSQAELDALARFRGGLLDDIRAAGIPRPDPSYFGVVTDLVDRARRALRDGRADTAAPTAADHRRTEPVWPARREAEPDAEPEEPQPELPPSRPVEELLAELDELVGLEPVKAEVKLITNLLIVQKLREERGLPTVAGSRHLVFTGNPGTGKTTVARLLSEILRSLGVVSKGHLVETDRSALVAGFVGQTAERTRSVIESAIGGTLLIDEAYALARGNENDFGREAIDTLVKMMEDLREELVIVAAGYPDEMATFVAANPGLQSRFPKTIHFPDYVATELAAIFSIIAASKHYELDEGVGAALVTWFDAQPRDRGFGNGRVARNLFEASVARQASRLVEVTEPTDEQLVTLTVADVIGEVDP